MTGGGNADNLDPYRLSSVIDGMRYFQLYESLTVFDANAIPQLLLAEDITPNLDATLWTIRLRPGIEFHNGKDLTADDVKFSLQRVMNPKNPGEGAGMALTMDAANIKKVDKLTVQVPFKAPFATFSEVLANYGQFMIVPVGFDPNKPVGTGPFKFESFAPGVQSRFVRNGNYWETGKPYFDDVTITDYSDEESQTNALLSGQIDGAALLSTKSLSNLGTGKANITVSVSGGWNPFCMRVDLKPWNDVRVRQAMRLIVDRHQMLEVVFGGKGLIGNDVTSIWDPFYDHSLPQRTQDLEQARSLLRQAGQENLAVELVTSDMAQGVVDTSQVFAQQATGAGVKVNIRQVTPSQLFGKDYLNWPFSMDFWYYNPYVTQSGQCLFSFNETHFKDPQYVSLYRQAIATVDNEKRKTIAQEMMRIEYDRGPYIIPYFTPEIDASAPKVMGVRESKCGVAFDVGRLKNLWFA